MPETLPLCPLDVQRFLCRRIRNGLMFRVRVRVRVRVRLRASVRFL